MWDITIGKSRFAAYRNTYGEVPVGTRLLCAQSIGMVEAAINKGDLAATLGEGLYAEVVFRKAAAGGTEKKDEKQVSSLYFSQWAASPARWTSSISRRTASAT